MRIKEEIKKSFLLICITSSHKYDEGSTQLIKYSNLALIIFTASIAVCQVNVLLHYKKELKDYILLQNKK